MFLQGLHVRVGTSANYTKSDYLSPTVANFESSIAEGYPGGFLIRL